MVIRNIPKKLIYFQIIYNCVIKFLITDFNFPSTLNYVTDLVTIAILFYSLKKTSFKLHVGRNKSLVVVGILLLVGTLSALLSFEGTSILYVWSLRNNFRLFVFFYGCCEILEEEDVHKILEILVKFLYANIVVCLYEYFVRGYKYDYLGGLSEMV